MERSKYRGILEIKEKKRKREKRHGEDVSYCIPPLFYSFEKNISRPIINEVLRLFIFIFSDRK